MTPQEFNLLANQAQLDIFEQYFYDLNQFNRAGQINNEHANIISNIKEKIDLFRVDEVTLNYNISFELPVDLYRLSTVTYNSFTEVEATQKNELIYIVNSPLTTPTTSYPIFLRTGNKIKVYPETITSSITCSYIKKPSSINWTYFEVNNTPLYNSTAVDHQDCELHDSEEVNLVNKILTYAGIIAKSPDVYQAAETKENKKITQEKS